MRTDKKKLADLELMDDELLLGIVENHIDDDRYCCADFYDLLIEIYEKKGKLTDPQRNMLIKKIISLNMSY